MNTIKQIISQLEIAETALKAFNKTTPLKLIYADEIDKLELDLGKTIGMLVRIDSSKIISLPTPSPVKEVAISEQLAVEKPRERVPTTTEEFMIQENAETHAKNSVIIVAPTETKKEHKNKKNKKKSASQLPTPASSPPPKDPVAIKKMTYEESQGDSYEAIPNQDAPGYDWSEQGDAMTPRTVAIDQAQALADQAQINLINAKIAKDSPPKPINQTYAAATAATAMQNNLQMHQRTQSHGPSVQTGSQANNKVTIPILARTKSGQNLNQVAKDHQDGWIVTQAHNKPSFKDRVPYVKSADYRADNADKGDKKPRHAIVDDQGNPIYVTYIQWKEGMKWDSFDCDEANFCVNNSHEFAHLQFGFRSADKFKHLGFYELERNAEDGYGKISYLIGSDGKFYEVDENDNLKEVWHRNKLQCWAIKPAPSGR